MRPNNQNRRGRGRGQRKPHGGGGGGGGHSHGGMPSKGQNYDSSGPDIRVRGNAYQVLEKYLQLARDAGTAGDRIAAENFLQHADHYYRVVASMNEGRRPQIGGREVSVADMNVHNVSQGLSAAMSGHGHSNPSGGDDGSDMQPGDNRGNGGGNGQNRPQQNQHHQQQAPRDSHGNNNNGSGQNGDQSQASADSSGNSDDEPQRGQHGDEQRRGQQGNETRRGQHSDEQPDYPDEALPADQQTAAPNGDGGQADNRQPNRTGRGRRRGPGRRVRGENDGPAPEGSSTPDTDGAE